MQHSTLDPYAILGVARDASPGQMARAYRRLAKRYHPDMDPDPAAALQMRRINEAWRIVSRRLRGRRPGAQAWNAGHWTAPPRAGSASAATWARWRATPPAAATPEYRPHRVGVPVGQRGRVATQEPVDRPFRDTGWAALLAASVVVTLLFVATYLGS